MAVGLALLILNTRAEGLSAGRLPDGDYVDADAGSLGVDPVADERSRFDNDWCVVDAGTLGLSDPVGACH